MVFHLTSDELKHRVVLSTELDEAGLTLTAAVDVFNATMTVAWDEVVNAQQHYNELVIKAQDFVNGVYQSRHVEYERRTEEWQDSQEGHDVHLWLEEWLVNLEDSDLEMPERVAVPDLAAATLAELPEDAQY